MLNAAGESGTLAYCCNNILYEMPFVAILMLIVHLEFYENWSGKPGESRGILW